MAEKELAESDLAWGWEEAVNWEGFEEGLGQGYGVGSGFGIQCFQDFEVEAGTNQNRK